MKLQMAMTEKKKLNHDSSSKTTKTVTLDQ